MYMLVVCVVQTWPVWRPAFRYDADAHRLLRLSDLPGGAWAPCPVSALFAGLPTAQLRAKPPAAGASIDLGAYGGKFDADAPPRPFEARFGTSGLVVASVLAMHQAPTVPVSSVRLLFPLGLDPEAVPLVANMPPELLFAVAAQLRAVPKPPRVLDVCHATYQCAKVLSPRLAAKLLLEEARHAELAGWHAMGYTSPTETAMLAVSPAGMLVADHPRHAARILASIVERKPPLRVRDGLDAAALLGDRALRWTSALALGLLCDAGDKTPVPTVDEWAGALLLAATDDEAGDAYY
jgi:hypothetical protein